MCLDEKHKAERFSMVLLFVEQVECTCEGCRKHVVEWVHKSRFRESLEKTETQGLTLCSPQRTVKSLGSGKP